MENEMDLVPESTEVPQEVTAETPATAVAEEEPTEALTPEMVDQMVRDAENRGYLRGRNEAVDARMESPGRGKRPECADDDDGEDAVMILREMRRSVWE